MTDLSLLQPRSIAEAIALQREIARRVVCEDANGPVRRVAGVDVGFPGGGTRGRAAVAVLDFPSLASSETAVAQAEVNFPYVSGPGRLRGTFMKSSGFSLYHLFMASMGGTCPRAFWGMW